ncbi:MAG: hypothetical protein OEY73_06510 [Hadesarchaea archaeon]|nr:hypothetical protein [Hadesarchaea archaeon]
MHDFKTKILARTGIHVLHIFSVFGTGYAIIDDALSAADICVLLLEK